MADRHDPIQTRLIWPPEPGFFRLRLIPGGWGVPARILHDPAGQWQAVIDDIAYPPHADPERAEHVARIWHGAQQITQPEYEWLRAVKAHAALTDPDHPALNPRRRMEPMRLKPLIPRTPHS